MLTILLGKNIKKRTLHALFPKRTLHALFPKRTLHDIRICIGYSK